MNNIDNIQPNLIEQNVKYFMGATLNNCHKFKDRYFNNIFNVSMLIGFILLLSIILFAKYKGTRDANQIAETDRKNREMIIYKLLKIKQENIDDRKMRNNLITNLPTYRDSAPIIPNYNT